MTPEAGRVEEIQARHEKDRAENPLFFHPAYPDDVYRDRSTLLAALTTQAETIRQLKTELKALGDSEYAREGKLRETIRRLEEIRERHQEAEKRLDRIRLEYGSDRVAPGWLEAHADRAALLAALTTQAETIRRLEGVIADKYPAPPNHYLVALQNQLKGAEQRAEAAEGRLDIARCTLADIAGSRDMTLFIARRKAQRTYDETAAVEEAAE